MKIGDLLFIRGGNPISFLIQLIDNGKWSHCAMVVSDKGHILETDWYTTCKITKMHYNDYEIVDLGLSDEQKCMIPQLAINTVGTHYDYSYILGHMFKRGFNNPKAMVCSEVMTYMLGNIGWLNTDEVNIISQATPNELYAFVKNKLNKN